jgi:ParB family chromosome partitioning protein
MLYKRDERKLIKLPIDKILPSPYQPRREFDYYELLELASSIQKNGLIQPITVRRQGENYELISGERRLRACGFSGMKMVPCILVNASDRECSLMCLIENIQRTDLNFFEEAEGIKRLMDDFALSGQEVAEKLGMAQSTLSNKMRLLRLSAEQKKKIMSAGLTERHARALLRLAEEKRDDMLNRIIAEQLTVTDTEKAVTESLLPQFEDKHPIRRGNIGDLRIFSNSISRIIGTMRRSGVDAKSQRNETEDYIKYTITIPKNGGEHKDPKLTVL